jgi:hypothetical protein
MAGTRDVLTQAVGEDVAVDRRGWRVLRGQRPPRWCFGHVVLALRRVSTGLCVNLPVLLFLLLCVISEDNEMIDNVTW